MIFPQNMQPANKWIFLIFQFLISIILISFSGCDRSSRPVDQVHDSSALHDSLNILDSMVNQYNTKDNPLAVAFAKRAVILSEKSNRAEMLVQSYVLLGNAFSQSAKDSSYIYYNKALIIASREKLEKQRSKLLRNIALLYYSAAENQMALLLLDSSLRIIKRHNDLSNLSSIYISMGTIKEEMKDVSGAELMYQKAFNISKSNSQYGQMGLALGNLARFEKNPTLVFRKQKEALHLFDRVVGNEEGKASVLINMGYDHSDPDSAIYYYRSALSLIKNSYLPEIEIASYNNMAYSFLEKGDIRNAISCLSDHAIPLALHEKNYDWLYTLYDSFAEILMQSGEYKEAALYQKKSLEAKIEADLKKSTNQLRLLSTLFDVRSKDREILIQQIQIRQAQLWLAISILAIILFISGIIWIAQRSRMKLQRQRIAAARRIIEMEENQKERTARELHDITGQFVLSITDQVDKTGFADNESREILKEKIENARQSLRLLSHKMNKVMVEQSGLDELLLGLCEDLHNLTGLMIDLELPGSAREYPQEVVLHSFRIVQELLMNAVKYASEGTVRIRIRLINNDLEIHYIDNGPGFEPGEVKGGGMGLMNIHERVKLLGGAEVLSTSPGNGTSWKIKLPLPGNQKNER